MTIQLIPLKHCFKVLLPVFQYLIGKMKFGIINCSVVAILLQ